MANINYGELAAPKKIFGEFNRYAVAPIHSRLGGVEWFVWDSESLDELGLSTVIRQAATESEAVAGLR